MSRRAFLGAIGLAGLSAVPVLAGCGSDTSDSTSTGSASSTNASSSQTAQSAGTDAADSASVAVQTVQTVSTDQQANAQVMDAFAVLNGDALIYYDWYHKDIRSAPLDGGKATTIVPAEFNGRGEGAYLQRIGDRLIYVGSPIITTDYVYAMDLNGSNSAIIYEFEGDGGSDDGTYISPMQITAVGERVYVVYDREDNNEGGMCGIKVVSFEADGSDVRTDADMDFGLHGDDGMGGSAMAIQCVRLYEGKLYVTDADGANQVELD